MPPDLPEFDGTSNAQGVGGITPELWKQAAEPLGAGVKPEHSPEVSAILDREVAALDEQFAGQQQPQQPQAPVQQQAAPTASPTPEAGPPGEGQQEPPMTTDRLQEIRRDFRGNFPKLASEYDRLLQERQESKSVSSSENDKLTRQLAELQEQLAAATATGMFGSGRQQQQETQRAPQMQSVQGLVIDRDEFLDDPATSTAKVLRHELANAFAAQEAMARERADEGKWREKEKPLPRRLKKILVEY